MFRFVVLFRCSVSLFRFVVPFHGHLSEDWEEEAQGEDLLSDEEGDKEPDDNLDYKASQAERSHSYSCVNSARISGSCRSTTVRIAKATAPAQSRFFGKCTLCPLFWYPGISILGECLGLGFHLHSGGTCCTGRTKKIIKNLVRMSLFTAVNRNPIAAAAAAADKSPLTCLFLYVYNLSFPLLLLLLIFIFRAGPVQDGWLRQDDEFSDEEIDRFDDDRHQTHDHTASNANEENNNNKRSNSNHSSTPYSAAIGVGEGVTIGAGAAAGGAGVKAGSAGGFCQQAFVAALMFRRGPVTDEEAREQPALRALSAYRAVPFPTGVDCAGGGGGSGGGEDGGGCERVEQAAFPIAVVAAMVEKPRCVVERPGCTFRPLFVLRRVVLYTPVMCSCLMCDWFLSFFESFRRCQTHTHIHTSS